MKYNDFVRQYQLREKKFDIKKNEIAKKVLMEYSSNYELLCPLTGNYLDDLLYNYFLLKVNKDNYNLEVVMNRFNFNYSMSIHNAIYYLLGLEHDLEILDTDPLWWPGVDKIEEENDIYTLSTYLGQIKVSKASDIFKSTSSSYIFDKPLMGKCYDRSYDFIRDNKSDYQAVLMYMPNFFSGGHYHAYLENDTSILDIAANSYYSKEEGSKVLKGEIIKKLDYYDIERNFKRLSERVPEIRKEKAPKLLTLCLYYDIKNQRKY